MSSGAHRSRGEVEVARGAGGVGNAQEISNAATLCGLAGGQGPLRRRRLLLRACCGTTTPGGSVKHSRIHSGNQLELIRRVMQMEC